MMIPDFYWSLDCTTLVSVAAPVSSSRSSVDLLTCSISKEVIPYTSKIYKKDELCPVFHHVGVYAYRKEILSRYVSWGSSNLEISEGLEQLRFMENNKKILCVEVEAKGRKFWELNNPEDIGKLEDFMSKMGIN